MGRVTGLTSIEKRERFSGVEGAQVDLDCRRLMARRIMGNRCCNLGSGWRSQLYVQKMKSVTGERSFQGLDIGDILSASDMGPYPHR